jgi:cytochrome c553
MKKLLLAVVFSLSSAAFAAEPKFELKGDAAKGEAHYKSFCISCHGEKGQGDGLAAASLTPKPTNFADAANAERLTDEWVYKIIKDGGATHGKSELMVSWTGTLTDDDMRNVGAYVLKFKAGKGGKKSKK